MISKTPLLNRYDARSPAAALADYEAAKVIAGSRIRSFSATWVKPSDAFREARAAGEGWFRSVGHARQTLTSWPSRAAEGFFGSSRWAGGKEAFLHASAIQLAVADRAKAIELAATDPVMARVLAPTLAGMKAATEPTSATAA